MLPVYDGLLEEIKLSIASDLKQMTNERELEIQQIRLQFLEEATEYLNTIKTGVLALAAGVETQEMAAVLRAVHSIKGGAAMMGFETLSHLAHRLEDFLKVIKLQQQKLDTEVANLLLAGVEGLHQVIAFCRQGRDIDPQWLADNVNLVFEHLYQHLGDPTPTDAATLLLLEEGQDDIVAMIFETEIEGYLQRLESVLAHPEQPCLFEEVSNMAQELGGLGEMLQIDSFIKLCESITRHMEATPDRSDEIAKSALQAWRRSQALMVVGQVDQLPEQIDLVGNV
jgi:chemotaxis family two-component system sensor histidine kinase/response regulator PixL